MHKKSNKNRTKYNLNVRSKIHPEIYHTALIDLHCYEQIPKEKTICKSNNIDMYCYENMAKEKSQNCCNHQNKIENKNKVAAI